MRYLAADVRVDDGWETNAVWFRGTDAGGYWPSTPTPRRNDPHPDYLLANPAGYASRNR